MARKILNRKELREESEAAARAERAGDLQGAGEQEDQGGDKPAKKVTKRKTRAKANKEVRLKAFWGVFTQTLTQVGQYEYSERDEAQKRATDLTESKKTPHFVQLVKKVIEE